MNFRVNQMLKSPLMVGVWITAVVTVAGTVYALMNPRSNSSIPSQQVSGTPQSSSDTAFAATATCLTIVSDPNPPLNVRSAPTDRYKNVVGGVQAGELLTVVSRQGGWLQISAPVAGWVDKALTKTTCDRTEQAELSNSELTAKTDSGNRLLAEAIEAYQSGDLDGAIASIKSIPDTSSAYGQAQIELRKMPQQWRQAKTLYANAQIALREKRSSDVLKLINDVPDIRFWREKFTPLVKEAIYYQQHGTSASKNSKD
jgi:Bacterial SH3 domain